MQIQENNIINLTDIAIEKFKEMIFNSEHQDSYLKISLELDGTKMFYNIDLCKEILDSDKIYDFKGLKIIINQEDEELLNGLNIDYIKDENGDNFVIDNPNIITELEDEDSLDGCGCCCGHC